MLTLAPDVDLEAPVRVFRNLRHACFSIMQGGRLRASARAVRLADVELRVRASGRARMLREQRRNIHAFAVGRLLDFVHPGDPRVLEPLAGRRACYDPYRFPSFVDCDTGDPVRLAALVQLDDSGMTYIVDAPSLSGGPPDLRDAA